MKPPKRCPMCGSSTGWVHINTYHEGYSFLKALIGKAFLGNRVGFWAGLIGKRKVLYTCRQCHFTMEYKR